MDIGIDKYKILVVDDNPHELNSFQSYFRDYNIVTCIDPEVAYEKINNEPFNLIILDIYMKKMNGLKLYKHIKKSKFNNHAYTIAYTGITDSVIQDVISDMGFNDIIEKPTNFEDLELKIKKIIKEEVENNLFSDIAVDDFVEDRENFTYSFKNYDLNLTYKEYEILKLLLSRRGNIVTHKEIYEELYGKEERSANIIKSHIKNLRSKISKAGPEKDYIKTAPLKGYCLVS